MLTIVSYKYIGGVGEEGKEEPPLKDFPPDLRDSEICLSLGATRGAKAIVILDGGLCQGSHLRSALWEAAEEVLWSPGTLKTQGSSQPQDLGV